MIKKIIYSFMLLVFLSSCETMGSVKRGLTGEKKQSTDEFLIQKKNPLILPPDYEDLPTPEERSSVAEEISVFEETLGISIEDDTSPSSSGSVEDSILKKIRSK
jgi:hypothetical protein